MNMTTNETTARFTITYEKGDYVVRENGRIKRIFWGPNDAKAWVANWIGQGW